jgi:hypothetical protein
VGATGYWLGRDLRRRWVAALGLALLVGLALCVPLTASAAARRTASSLDRMRDELRPYHADVQFEDEGDAPDDALERIRSIPGVEVASEGISVLARPKGTDLEFGTAFGQAGIGPELGTELERLRLESGRRPAAPDEVALRPSVARELGVGVGDRVEIETLTWDGLDAAFGGISDDYDGPLVPVDVVGIGEGAEGLTGGDSLSAPSFVLDGSFFEEWGEEIAYFDGIFIVRLEGGLAAGEDFERALQAEFADREDVSVNLTGERSRVDDAVDAQALGLWSLAGASALAAIVAVAQAVARHVRSTEHDARTLSALGLGRRSRTTAVVGAALVPAIGGVVVGSLASVGASRWFPTGAAGRAEPDPGVDLDVGVMLVGALATVGIVAVASSLAQRRAARPERPSRLVEQIVAVGAPVAIVTGVRGALQPGAGRRSVPVRSALVAGAAGVAGVLAALVFGASLDRLTESPARYGFNFDAAVGVGDELSDAEALASAERVVDEPLVGSAVLARVNNVLIEGRDQLAFATTPVKGDLGFTVVDGRAATGPDEIAIGTRTMRALDAEIGDVVEARGEDGPVALTVVGRALFPAVENEDPAHGVWMTSGTYDRLASVAEGFPDLYVELADGADPAAAVAALEDLGFVSTAVEPAVIGNLRGVATIPYILAAFLAALGFAAVAHALVTGLRRRRHELAILRALGFMRSDLATAVVVQALVFGVVGLLVGTPTGFGIGLWAWSSVADGLGFASDVSVPGWSALLVPVVLVVVLAIAAPPASAAARTRPAQVLRAE